MGIPASVLVTINPGVLAPSGTGVDFVGMFLTTNTRVPTGAPTSFPSALAVSNYFGPSSTEAQLAAVYFQGFDQSSIKPGTMWFAQYPEGAVAAYLRGAAVTNLTALQAITAGHLSVTIDGVAKTTSTLDLSTASSFSMAASDIASALSLAGGQTCTYDAISQSFVIESGTTGSTSTITFGSSSTGNAATVLGLTQATGAVLSQGAAAATSVATFMDALVAFTSNFVSVVPMWATSTLEKESLATWIAAQNVRYAAVINDTDATIIQTPSAFTGFGSWLVSNSINGVAAVYNDLFACAMIAGIAASTNYLETNGRVNYKFRTNSLMPGPVVTDQTAYANMLANGYSSYCGFNVQQNPNMIDNGQVSGSYKWLDSYYGAIHLKLDLQAALVAALQNNKSLPYDDQGFTKIHNAGLDPVLAALNFGTIRTGVTPSASEATAMNAAAGVTIDKTVGTVGYYFQVKDPGAVARAARLSPICNLWYADGESIQQITLNSTVVL